MAEQYYFVEVGKAQKFINPDSVPHTCNKDVESTVNLEEYELFGHDPIMRPPGKPGASKSASSSLTYDVSSMRSEFKDNMLSEISKLQGKNIDVCNSLQRLWIIWIICIHKTASKL